MKNDEPLRFMFGKEQLGYFLPLALFANMSSLNICGGDFYSDKLIDLLEQIGQGKKHSKPISFAFLGERLDELDIYAVGELDMKGVAMMTIFCRFIFPHFPSTLYFSAGLKALAYVVVSFDLSFKLSMLEVEERGGETWNR